MRSWRLVLVLLVVAFAAPAAASADPGITVTGSGTATATSDLATYGFGVSAPARTSSGALRVAGGRIRALLGVLRGAGVAPGDIQTSSLTVSRHVRRTASRRRVVVYRAASSVQVTARGIVQIRAVPSQAVAAGATLEEGPDFSLADATGLGRRALTGAFDDARTKAETLAREAGVTLGPPVSISEGTPATQPPQPESSSGAPRSGAPAPPVPVSPGQQTVTASVTVVFAIES